MKSSNKLFIFTGVALALVAVLMAITMSSGGKNKADAQDEKDNGKVSVVKAAVDLEPFTVISMSDVVVEEMSANDVPADSATDIALVVGQSYKLGAIKGDILLTSQLQPPGIRNSIAEGKRAVSIEVDTQGLMSGLIVDGDYVDVIFKTRVDLKRILTIQGLEVEEDGPYQAEFNSGTQADASTDPTDEEKAADKANTESGIDPGAYQGKPGSEFTVLDGGQNLEPLAKLLVQDVKVLRVIAPGVKYDAQGQQVQQAEDSTTNADDMGQLIIEVTPAQAEVIAFMQDQNSAYEIAVRGEDDHEVATTTGITFQILIDDEQWSLPYPMPIFSPIEGQEATEGE